MIEGGVFLPEEEFNPNVSCQCFWNVFPAWKMPIMDIMEEGGLQTSQGLVDNSQKKQWCSFLSSVLLNRPVLFDSKVPRKEFISIIIVRLSTQLYWLLINKSLTND